VGTRPACGVFCLAELAQRSTGTGPSLLAGATEGAYRRAVLARGG